MIPLMRTVNSAVNFDLELSKRKKAHKNHLKNFKSIISYDSQMSQPSCREAESLLRESTRRGHSIITYHVGEGYKASFPCPWKYIPEEDAFCWKLVELPTYRLPTDVLSTQELLTNEVGHFRKPRTYLAVSPTRIGDPAIRSKIFASNALFAKIQRHPMRQTACNLAEVIEKERKYETDSAKFRSRKFMDDESKNSKGSSEIDKSRANISRTDRKNHHKAFGSSG